MYLHVAVLLMALVGAVEGFDPLNSRIFCFSISIYAVANFVEEKLKGSKYDY